MQHLSLLPQPSRTASPRKISELSASQFNARSMGPPPSKLLKTQHKSLAARVDEFPGNKQSYVPSASRIGNGTVKPTTLAGATRPNNLASSTSAIRPPSVISSRTTSNSSFASSVGPGASYSHTSRPQPQTTNPRLQRPNGGLHRPASSMDHPVGPPGAPRPGKRKGMAPFPSVVERPFPPMRSVSCGTYQPQNPVDTHWEQRQLYPKTIREISISTMMGNLSLEDHKLPSTSSASMEYSNVPVTPSHIPKLRPNAVSPSKGSPKKSSKSPCKTPTVPGAFLSRDSNLRAAPWDPEERFGEMESKFDEFLNKIDGATQESDKARALAESYKLRGTLSSEIKSK